MTDTQRLSGDSKQTQGLDGSSLSVGATLRDRYKITGVLGVGGMGSVYLARDMNFTAINRQVAVKEMLNQTSDPQMQELTRRNFEREANILAELSHAAIPNIYDYFTFRDRAYLVMEFINGRDMEALINTMRDFMPFDVVKRWTLELLDVLDYLHSHQPEPIIFRDMKPSNVMIDSTGHVRLIDFGIAKTFQGNQKGTMIGTEGYSPPEQYRGEASPAADIYAMGATLHHLLTKRDPRLEPPFSFHERPIRSINPSTPPDFEALVMKALEYHVANRYPNAGAFRDAVQALDAPPAPAASVIVTPAVSPLVAPPVAQVGAVMPAAPAAPPAGQSPMVEGPDIGVKPIWKFKAEDEIRGAPVFYKGTIYFGAYDNNLYALDAATGTFKWKFPTDNGVSTTPAIAPDENLIVFGSEDNSFYAVDLRTGKVQWTVQTAAPIRSSPTIFGGFAFFGSDDGRLYAVRLTTNRVHWKVELGVPVRCKPAIAPERILVGTEQGEMLGVDLMGAIKWRYKTRKPINSTPIVHDNIVYFGSLDMYVHAVDAVNGFGAWRFRTNKPVVGGGVISGSTLYIGSADKNLYALDLNLNGRELWHFTAEDQIVATPALANGVLYVTCVDKKIYSMDAKKGKLRWFFETEGPIAASPCVVDKTVYVASTDHYLYALNA